MHSCEEYRILISALIDDEISDRERSELLAHIAECTDCKAYLDDQMLIHEAVQSMDCTAPVGFADGVMARVHETKQEVPRRKVVAFPRWKQFATLAACCAVIVLGVITMDGGMLTMDSSSNCAAPEAALMTTGVAQTADDCAVETEGAALTDAAEPPQAGAKSAPEESAPESQSEVDNGACAADSAAPPAAYAATPQFAARLTTDSDLAAAWVRDVLGQEWVSGTCYHLTEDEYALLREMLTNGKEDFDEMFGTEDSQLYQLFAQ